MTAGRGVAGTGSSTGPLVSVLLASRDGARYLEESLESLASQTYSNVELVAVDDGSTDATASILASFASRQRPVTRVLRTQGVGLAGALALAASDARGELLARQDDDDRSHPERIERQVRHLTSHPDVVALGTRADLIDESGHVVGSYPVPIMPGGIRSALVRGTPFVHGSVMMRRTAYQEAGGYRACFRASQDVDLWLRLGDARRFANLPETLYFWRLHPAGVFSRAREAQIFYAAAARAFAEERRAIGQDSAALLDRYPDADALLARYGRAGRLALRLGEAYAREGRAGDARRYLAMALRDPSARGEALPWWAITWALPLTKRGQRAAGRGGRATPATRP